MIRRVSQVFGLALMASIFASGCATLFEGTSQEIMVTTSPEGASCVLERNGISIGGIVKTPGATFVKKTKEDITIRCNKSGFQEATVLNRSGLAGAGFGNVLTYPLLPITVIVDSASGADNKYDNVVSVTLLPDTSSSNPQKKAPANVRSTTPVADKKPVAPGDPMSPIP